MPCVCASAVRVASARATAECARVMCVCRDPVHGWAALQTLTLPAHSRPDARHDRHRHRGVIRDGAPDQYDRAPLLVHFGLVWLRFVMLWCTARGGGVVERTRVCVCVREQRSGSTQHRSRGPALGLMCAALLPPPSAEYLLHPYSPPPSQQSTAVFCVNGPRVRCERLHICRRGSHTFESHTDQQCTRSHRAPNVRNGSH